MLGLKKYYQLLFFFVSPVFLMAENTLEIINAQTNINTSTTVSFEMNNDSAIVAFQVDLTIPAGISYVNSTATLNAARISDHIIKDTILPDGTLRILGYSLTNNPFTGNSGELLTIQISSGFTPGNYPLVFSNAVLGNSLSNNIITGTSNGTITALGSDIYLNNLSIDFGSVPLLTTNDRYLTIYNTGNTQLNIHDLNFTNEYFSVIGDTSFIISASSNQSVLLRFNSQVKGSYSDSLIIVSDDLDESLVYVYLSSVAYAINELHTADMSVYSGDYATMDFTMNNMEPIIGVQFDINLPTPLTFAQDSAFLTTRKTDHTISANMISSNVLRVVAYSDDNLSFTGDDGLLLQLGFNVEGAGGDYSISITNVVIGDTSGINGVSAYTNGTLHIAAPDISVNGSLDFGDVSILETGEQSLTVYNYGNDTLTIGALQFSNSKFSASESLPVNILPGNNYSLSLLFNSSTEGIASSTLSILSNDPDEYPKNVSLTANSFIPNYISVIDSMYSYGDTMFVGINVQNHEPFTGFQFDLHYSDSLTLLPALTTPGSRAANHTLQHRVLSTNDVRIFAYSNDQSQISGSTGAVVWVPFVGDSAVYGEVPLALDSIILGNAQLENIYWGKVDNSITIAMPQQIILDQGWNIISLNVAPYYTDSDSVFSEIIESGNLIKAINESGGIIQYITGIGWLNTIDDILLTDGYYVKVDTVDTITTEGALTSFPYSIPLTTGWNILGYPAYNPQSAQQYIQPLIDNGSFYKLIDEIGGFIQNISGIGLINTIGTVNPGEGYYLKVLNNTSLPVYEGSAKEVVKVINNKKIPTTHFSSIGGNIVYNPMNFVLKVDDQQKGIISDGDEIAVYDGAFCVGASVIGDPESGIVDIVTTMTENTNIINGYTPGNKFRFHFWDSEQNRVYQDIIPVYLNDTEAFTPFSTFAGELSGNAISINENHSNPSELNLIVAPNPVKHELKVYFIASDEGIFEMQVFNSNAKQVLDIANNPCSKGWNHINTPIHNLASGIYVVHVKYHSTNKVLTESFSFIKR